MARPVLTDAEREERRLITNARQTAVRQAWKEEQDRVREGKGTRNWSTEEQKELLETGRIQGYDGHHMKSVCACPEEAGNSKNIQFLTEDEHLNGAHQGSYHHPTNGYYDPNTGTMHEFTEGSLEPAPTIDLTETYASSKIGEETNDDYLGTAGTGTTVSSEVIDEAENINSANNTEQSQEKSNNSEEYMGSVGNISDDTQENNGPSEENSSGEDMEE